MTTSKNKSIRIKKSKNSRRQLNHETLENRQLLAADLGVAPQPTSHASAAAELRAEIQDVVNDLSEHIVASVGEGEINSLRGLNANAQFPAAKAMVVQSQNLAWEQIVQDSKLPELGALLQSRGIPSEVVDLVVLELIDIENEAQVTADLLDGIAFDVVNNPDDAAVELPPHYESLRQQLGDDAFAEWLHSNKETTGNAQGHSGGKPEGANGEEFERVEKVLEQWLNQFEEDQTPAKPDDPNEQPENDPKKDNSDNKEPKENPQPPATVDPKNPDGPKGSPKRPDGPKPDKGGDKGEESPNPEDGDNRNDDAPNANKQINKKALARAKRAFENIFGRFDKAMGQVEKGLQLITNPSTEDIDRMIDRLPGNLVIGKDPLTKKPITVRNVRTEIAQLQKKKSRAESDLAREYRKENPNQDRIDQLKSTIQTLGNQIQSQRALLRPAAKARLQKVAPRFTSVAIRRVENLENGLRRSLDRIARLSKCPAIKKLVEEMKSCYSQHIQQSKAAVKAAKQGDSAKAAEHSKAAREAASQLRAKAKKLCESVNGLLAQ